MFLWDELDDWLGAGRHLVRGTCHEAAGIREAIGAAGVRAGARLAQGWFRAVALFFGAISATAAWRAGSEL